MVVVDQLALRLGRRDQLGPGGKKWVKIDVSDSDNPIGQLFQAANPGNFAAYLEGVTTFEDKGDETVDGVETHHYDVTVDTATMLEEQPRLPGSGRFAAGPAGVDDQRGVRRRRQPAGRDQGRPGRRGRVRGALLRLRQGRRRQAPPADQVGDLDLGGN